MHLLWAASGAAAGLAAGALLRGTVFRLSVPPGEPDRTQCPGCGTRVGIWFALRCPHCGRGLGRPLVLEIVTGAVLAVLAARFAGQPELLAFGFFGAIGVALAAIDINVQRLPDRLTLPAIPVLIALLGTAALASHDLPALLHSLVGGLAMAAAYVVLALIRPGQLGGGDIKLAVLAGLALGWLGWPALILGAALGFVLAGLAGLVLLGLRKVTLRSHMSFGPFLIGGALIGILATGGLQGG